jgi:hypothetical protein
MIILSLLAAHTPETKASAVALLVAVWFFLYDLGMSQLATLTIV